MDVPEAHLLKNDRLEPSEEMPVVQAFESAMPAVVKFWRQPAAPVVHHRNPLFDALLGITPNDSLVVDQLHALSLGVLKYFIAAFVWALFLVNVFSIVATTEEARAAMNAQALRALLFDWYASEEKTGLRRSRIQDLTGKMLGSRGDPQMKLHGA